MNREEFVLAVAKSSHQEPAVFIGLELSESPEFGS
jgi:hypothetical protein